MVNFTCQGYSYFQHYYSEEQTLIRAVVPPSLAMLLLKDNAGDLPRQQRYYSYGLSGP